MRPSVGDLKPRARALLEAASPAADLRPALDRPYLVKGWLDRATLSVVYGPSNVGKSFLALDWAHHVSKGRAWGGRRVVRSRVLYVAAEGDGSFANRVAGLDDPEFWVLAAPVTMIGKASDSVPLAEMVTHLAGTAGNRFDLIIFDTLARVMGGGDENAAPDIADINPAVIERDAWAIAHHQKDGKDAESQSYHPGHAGK